MITDRILNAKLKIEKVKKSDKGHGTEANTNEVSLTIASTPKINLSQSTVENTSANSTTTNTITTSLPNLPKLELPRFRGQVTEWSSFWDSYNSAIHSNDNISKVNKFNYLHSLLDGCAARSIKGLTLTSANYDAAILILQERFGENPTHDSGAYG